MKRPVTLIAGILGITTNAEAYLHPETGRFVQRDREEYIEGMNLYESRRSNHVGRVDWRGLASTKQTKKHTLSAKELMDKKDDATRRDAIKAKRVDRLKFFKQELRKLCTEKSTKNATPKWITKPEDCCKMDTCKAEADAIAEAYNAMWEKYAYYPKSYGLEDKSAPAQDDEDVHAGWLCNHWARFTWEAMEALDKKRKSLKCWRFARAGHVEWKKKGDARSFGETHNWVTATVGQKAVADGKYTVRLDPWNYRRRFIYTEKDHRDEDGNLFKSGYIALKSGAERTGLLLNIRVINAPKGKLVGPNGGPAPPRKFGAFWYRIDKNLWPGKTATAGLENK